MFLYFPVLVRSVYVCIFPLNGIRLGRSIKGYGEIGPGDTINGGTLGIMAKPPSEDWDRSQYNIHYLTRTRAQIAADESTTDQDQKPVLPFSKPERLRP